MSNICKEELNEFWLRREPAHRRRNRQKVKKQQMQVWRSKIFVKLLWYWWNVFWISLISHPAQGWIFWPDLNRNFLSAERPVVFRWRGHSSAEWGRDGKIQNWGKILPKKSWAKFFCDISVNWGCRPWLMIVQELLSCWGSMVVAAGLSQEDVWRGRNISRVSVIITTILLKKMAICYQKGRGKLRPFVTKSSH